MAELMKTHDMKASTKQKFRHTTDSNHAHPVAENLLDQAFEQEKPDQVWVSDITYIPTREGWLYLVCVLDLYSRKVVGWSMSNRMTKDLVLSALEMAAFGALSRGRTDAPFRSRQPVCQSCLSRLTKKGEHHVQHEPQGELL